MYMSNKRITPFLWFDTQAEEAAKFYTSIFPNSKIHDVSHYEGKEVEEVSGRPEGSVSTVEFELDGEHFTSLNGGPVFKFNESISFMVHCETQEEVDHYWSKLTEGGQEVECGWLKDKYGVSWQIVPNILGELLGSEDKEKSQRAMVAMLKMTKLDIEGLKNAYEGK